jgi:hypothetical protein
MREPRLCSSPSIFHPARFAGNGEMGEPCGMPRRLFRASVVRVFHLSALTKCTGVFRMMIHDRLTPPLTSLSRHSSIQVARNPWKGMERAMTSLLNLQSGEDTDSKTHIVALHCSPAYRGVQPISRSCARHLRLRQECALSFIVLPLPPRRAAVAGSRAYRKWRGAAPLRGR